jgi:hypothetical protein
MHRFIRDRVVDRRLLPASGEPVPFRSKATLERWLEEFLAQGGTLASPVSVLTQEGLDGLDTGLVVLDLLNAPTQVYMQPVAPDDASWAVTFLAREADASRTPESVAALAVELAAVAELCGYLELRSSAHLAVA